MTSFLSTAARTIGAKKILDYLMRNSPELKEKIPQALASGITADKIIKFFSKDKNFDKLKKTMEKDYPLENNANPLVQAQNVRDKNLGTDIGSSIKRNAAPMIGNAAGIGVGLALNHALPNLLKGPVEEKIAKEITTQQPPINQNVPINTQGEQQPPLNLGNANIQQPSNIQQHEEKNINIPEILSKHQSKEKIDELINAGNTAEGITAYFQKFAPKQIKDIEKESGLPFSKAVEQYIAENPQQKAQETEPLQETIEQPQAEAEEVNEVLTPNGFGEVKISRNGESIVEVDGKKHKVEDAKILKPPKEAAIEAMELIKSFTPEEMRSTHHMLNSYDEAEKKAFFVFHNGDAYVVDDISPDEYEELSKEVADAKTSGETIIGKWAKGQGSRGAGYNKVVKGHRERKVVPELVKTYRKLKVGYNLLSEFQRLLNEK